MEETMLTRTVDLPLCCSKAGLAFAMLDAQTDTDAGAGACAGACAVTLAVAGEVDMDNAAHLDHVLSAALATAPSVLVIDVSGVTFLGSAGIRAFADGHQAAARSDCAFRLCGATRMTRRVLEIAGLLRVFGLADEPFPKPDPR
jgi:anti-sigma B factor antagonist